MAPERIWKCVGGGSGAKVTNGVGATDWYTPQRKIHVLLRHHSGKVGDFTILWYEISSGSCVPKIIHPVHFSPSYSKYKGAGVFLDAVYMLCYQCTCAEAGAYRIRRTVEDNPPYFCPGRGNDFSLVRQASPLSFSLPSHFPFSSPSHPHSWKVSLYFPFPSVPLLSSFLFLHSPPSWPTQPSIPPGSVSE